MEDKRPVTIRSSRDVWAFSTALGDLRATGLIAAAESAGCATARTAINLAAARHTACRPEYRSSRRCLGAMLREGSSLNAAYDLAAKPGWPHRRASVRPARSSARSRHAG